MLEQRKKQRFELHLPYEIHRDGGMAPVRGYTANVSSAGVLFSSSTRFSIGDPIQYSLTLPRAEWGDADVRLHCTGTVLRVEPGRDEFVASIESYEFVRETVAASAAA